MTVAVIGAFSLAYTLQARAENNIIPPDEAAALARAHVEELKAAALQEEAAQAEAEAETSGKAAESANEKKGRTGASAASKTAGSEDDPEESSSAAAKPRILSRSAQADALRAKALKPLIVRYASENGLPYELADAVIRLESRYNPGARNGPNVGLTQVNVRTAQSLGYKGDAAGLLDVETNLRFGLKYLAAAYKLAGGDVCGTILRYQFGHRTTTMTAASRAYCAKVKVITASAE
jgi:soluble lytic murein transglycosylase-like protein